MQTTKIYENTTSKPVSVLGVGTIQPYDRVSVTAEFHTPVNLANYPGVIDLLADEAANGPASAPEDRSGAQSQQTAPSAPAQPGMQGSFDAQKVEGK